MGIREVINARSSIAVPVGIAFVVIAIVANFIIFRHSFSSHDVMPGSVPARDYYSDDDGATWYLDRTSNVPPYDHNGKTAVRAYLVRCKDGKVFVNYLKQFTPAGIERINVSISAGVDPYVAQAEADAIYAEYKKPGDAEWVPIPTSLPERPKSTNTPPLPRDYTAMTRIRTAKCPDGSIAMPIGPAEDAKPQ